MITTRTALSKSFDGGDSTGQRRYNLNGTVPRVLEPSKLRNVENASPRARGPRHDPLERPHYRARIVDSPVALVENLQSCAGTEGISQGYSPEFQVCLPYVGLFVWHVGRQHVVGDANQVLFVTGGEAFHLTAPAARRYGELIVTPRLDVLAEIAGTVESRLAVHAMFVRRSRRVDASVQALRARLLHASGRADPAGLATEELVLAVLRSALGGKPPEYQPRATTRRLIRRTKEFVEAHLSAPLRLSDVARAVNASPAYLTDVFRRAEGVPLHKYVVQLRLARAVVELPDVNDLTTLALDVGFSSHSHFAAVFRRAFGCTPSAFRESARVPPRPDLARGEGTGGVPRVDRARGSVRRDEG
jgi:AraC family transcriptional regulator